MKIPEIAHEHPLKVANLVEELTSYNYYISTICEEVPEYANYARNSKRSSILDCGTFEKGVPQTLEKYLQWIKDLKPTEYIVPDFLFEKDKTLDNYKFWVKDIIPTVEGKPIGVVQGQDLKEQVECYKELLKLCAKIAIPYDLPCEKDDRLLVVDSVVGNDSYSLSFPVSKVNFLGRYRLMEYLCNEGLLDASKEHHLLGIDLPIELRYYSKFRYNGKFITEYIDSIDTSSPIVHALFEVPYHPEFGVMQKNKRKMETLILENNISEYQIELIRRNIAIFKNFLTPAN